MTAKAEALRAQILELVAEYYTTAFQTRDFVPSETPVSVSGRCLARFLANHWALC